MAQPMHRRRFLRQVAAESQIGRMVRADRYRYCRYDAGRHAEQLIDLAKDPGEMVNLAEDPAHRGVLNEHRRLLGRRSERTGRALPAERPHGRGLEVPWEA